MKITPIPVGNSAAPAQTPPENAGDGACIAGGAPTPRSADEVTQQALQTAQQSLSGSYQTLDDAKVSQMQAALANNALTIDDDALATSMLRFFQK